MCVWTVADTQNVGYLSVRIILIGLYIPRMAGSRPSMRPHLMLTRTPRQRRAGRGIIGVGRHSHSSWSRRLVSLVSSPLYPLSLQVVVGEGVKADHPAPARVPSQTAQSANYQSPFTSTALPDRRDSTTSSGTSSLPTPLTSTPLWASTPSLPVTPVPTRPQSSDQGGHRRASSATQTRRHAPYTTETRRATYTHAYTGALRTRAASDLKPSYDASVDSQQVVREGDWQGPEEYIASWMSK